MGLSVLLAEDDVSLSAYVQDVLEGKGYRVVARQNAYAALEALQTEQIDLLLTDMMLPGLAGDVIADRARALRPGLPVVFMTGSYGLQFVLPHDPILRKPFSEEQLLAALERAAPRR